jgi:hypothetical protein
MRLLLFSGLVNLFIMTRPKSVSVRRAGGAFSLADALTLTDIGTDVHDHQALTSSAGSTACFAFQALKPPLRAAASKPILLSRRAARALVASSGQVQ